MDKIAQQFIESYRTASIDRLFEMESFSACWPVWKEAMADATSNFSDPTKIYNLGGKLSEIFKLTGSTGRDQSAVSGGGAAWEGIVCWYLNFILFGTRAVASKQSKTLIPPSILDAATVVYGNYQTNTESDLSVIALPSGLTQTSSEWSLEELDQLVKDAFHETELHVIQCKTNWNDNAQVPMLWDMIYSGTGFKDNKVKIGRNGYSINNLRAFSYSFVTVPSQKKEIKAGSMAVHRVANLTGGNFWGKPTKSGVALALSEIFGRVLQDVFAGNVQAHIGKNIQNGHIFSLVRK